MTRAPDIAEWEFIVENGKVREFARAVHDDSAGDMAPPTFPVCVTAAYVERLVADILKLDRRRTVHGEQEYEYLRPLRPGDRLRCRARVVEDYVKDGKRGGRMRFIVCETEMRDAATGDLVVRERATAIETAGAEGA
jgi:N-terminal half of MaoC dehydratase